MQAVILSHPAPAKYNLILKKIIFKKIKIIYLKYQVR